MVVAGGTRGVLSTTQDKYAHPRVGVHNAEGQERYTACEVMWIITCH